MKTLVQLTLLLLLASGAQAQTPQIITTLSVITPAGCAKVDVTGNKGAVGFAVTGTWTGTLQPEVQILDQSPTSSYVVPSTSATTQTTVTANGNYFFPSSAVAGASTVLLCGPTSTGFANVYLQTSTALSVLPGSGGGGGAVSSVFGRTGAVTAQTGDYTCAQVTNCSYTFFGNTMNPLTALVDPTTIIDVNSNSIAFGAPDSGSLTIKDTAGDGFQLGVGLAAAQMFDSVDQYVAIDTVDQTVSMADANGDYTILDNGQATIAVNNGGTGVFDVITIDGSSGTIPTPGSTVVSSQLEAPSFVTISSNVSKFTVSGCSATVSNGRTGTAGILNSGTTGTCTFTVTFGGSPSVDHGWACSVSDETTANLMRQTGTTTTTATFSGTTVTGDSIIIGCIGF